MARRPSRRLPPDTCRSRWIRRRPRARGATSAPTCATRRTSRCSCTGTSSSRDTNPQQAAGPPGSVFVPAALLHLWSMPMIKVTRRVLAVALLLVPAASFATKVPLPIEGASASINMQVQPEFLVNEAGAPTGDNPSYDLFVRRTRVQFAGNFANAFDFYLNVDNPNFGKFGNFTSRLLVQDARASWAPWGLTGGNVLFVDLGYMQIPLSHYELGSTTNYITADQQTDTVRMAGTPLQAFRDTGVQIRGWAMEKKVGYRFGIWE